MDLNREEHGASANRDKSLTHIRADHARSIEFVFPAVGCIYTGYLLQGAYDYTGFRVIAHTTLKMKA